MLLTRRGEAEYETEQCSPNELTIELFGTYTAVLCLMYCMCWRARYCTSGLSRRVARARHALARMGSAQIQILMVPSVAAVAIIFCGCSIAFIATMPLACAGHGG